MRGSVLRVVVLCALLVLAAAWSKEDHEIFRLRDEVELSEGVDTTFYDFLGITPSASHEDIVKAQRKKSRTLHPDKIKQSFVAEKSTPKPKSKSGAKPTTHVSKGPSQREIQATIKKATERYQRLTVVANILKGEGRERYDHFLRNGFPSWRGTGYYYTRFRPGLGSVLLGLFIAGGGAAHYGILVLNWRRHREFVEKYIRHARKAAWGDETGIKGIPGVDGPITTVTPPVEDSDNGAMQMTRRQKRQMEKETKKEKSRPKKSGNGSGTATPTTTEPTGPRKRVMAENGKVLIVDSMGNVFLEEESENGETQEFLLDVNEIPRPTVKDTALYRFPLWVYAKAVGRFVKDKRERGEVDEVTAAEEVAQEQPTDESDPASSFEKIDGSGVQEAANGPARKRNKKAKKFDLS